MTTEFKNELINIFAKLNDWIANENSTRWEDGGMSIGKQEIRIAGQVALLLADLPFPVTSTTDLDMITQPDYAVLKRLGTLVLNMGLSVESDSRLIWMPPKTTFHLLCDYTHLRVLYADHHDVLSAKIRFNRTKDKKLIETYKKYFPDFKP